MPFTSYKGLLKNTASSGAGGIALDQNFTTIADRIGVCNYAAVADPTVASDSTAGFSQGSRWINTATHKIFDCVDATPGAALWVTSSAGGAPGGSTNQIQYNNAGAFAGSSNLQLAGGSRLLIGAPTDDTTSQLQVSGLTSLSGSAGGTQFGSRTGTGSNYTAYNPTGADYRISKQAVGDVAVINATGIAAGSASPAAAIDTGLGRLTGGTDSGTYRNYIDPSSSSSFPAVDMIFPTGGIFRAASVSVAGTNDTFFQAIPPTTAGYGFMEAFGSAGMILGTAGNASPVIFKCNRAETGRINGTGLSLSDTGATPTTRLNLYTPNSTYDGQVLRADSYNLAGQYYTTFRANNTSGGIINWTFDVTNGSTLYANNLVMDRGNVGIGVATPLATLHAQGIANAKTGYLVGNSTSGQSYGLGIDAGTTSADYSLLIRNQAGTSDSMRIRGDGSVVFGPSGTPSLSIDSAGETSISTIIGSTTSGGWTITSGGTSTTPVSINGTSGQTADLLQCYDGSLSLSFAARATGAVYLKPLASAPAFPTLGVIYVGSDGHAYLYNGSVWKQLDN